MRFLLKIFILFALILIPASALNLRFEPDRWLEKLGVPDTHNPWSPLDLRGEIGMFTTHKLSKLSGDLPLCLEALSRAEIEHTALPDQTVNSCPLKDRISLDQSAYPYSASVRPTCRLAAAIVLWEENVLKPAALAHLGTKITRIEQSGIFNCRNIAGSTRRSQHASANAIDISGFRLEDGSRISLLADWGKDTKKGRFLTAVRNGSCDIFRGVLGPEYNAAHADHFHLDMGRYNICR